MISFSQCGQPSAATMRSRRLLPSTRTACDRSTILIVMGDTLVRRAVEDALKVESFVVRSAAAWEMLATERMHGPLRPDLVLLGPVPPASANAETIAFAVRQCGTTPVILIAPDDRAVGRLSGFEAGADDCLGSPFVMAELIARARAVLRRSSHLTSAVWQVDDLVIDNRRRTVMRGAKPIDLTKTEYDLLSALARNDDQVLSKRQLLRQVWDCDYLSPNLVEVHVCSLRRKLEVHGPRLVHTVRGVGYLLRSAQSGLHKTSVEVQEAGDTVPFSHR